MVKIIVATSKNRVIGNDNKLIWKLSSDLKRFKELTTDNPIVMGRKTFESLGNKVLPGRMNIIITRQANKEYEGAKVVTSLEQAIELAKQNDYKELMVIGGGEIYQMAIPLADTIYLTRVHTSIDCDTYFPALGAEWMLESSEPQLADEKHAFDFDFEIWQRK